MLLPPRLSPPPSQPCEDVREEQLAGAEGEREETVGSSVTRRIIEYDGIIDCFRDWAAVDSRFSAITRMRIDEDQVQRLPDL